MDTSMEPTTLGLMVGILFFLIPLLVNLFQRGYSRTRLHRMLEKDESVVNFLGVIDAKSHPIEGNGPQCYEIRG